VPDPPTPVRLRWLTASPTVDSTTRGQLLDCWREVSNAGGAVGFPFLPVDDEHVRPALEIMLASLDAGLDRLLVATVDGALAGWLLLSCNASPLTDHWAKVLRVQTALGHRGTGVGRALMTEVARSARDELGLDQLHLELRGGLGLERFYAGCGWQEIGRWPGALRLREDDRRDDVLMLLPLR